MIRILICDDEGIVRESLKFIIQQSFQEECELAFAKNGRTAMELADVFRPDVVLMDIQMPGVNGIEAMRGIRAKYENIVFIVLTAYDKIEYTQSSIDIGVMAYLTKPIKRKELVETLQKAMRIVDRQKEKASYDLEIQEKLESVVPMIENGFVYSMLLEESYSENAFFRYQELLDIKEECGYAMVVECGDDFNGGKMSNAVGAGIKLQKHFVLFRETVKEAVSGILGALMANRVTVLIPCHKEDAAYEERVKIIDHVRSMVRSLEKQIGLKFKVGIGSVKPWKHISQSYREAMDTVLQGIGKVTHSGDLPVTCIYEEDYPDELERDLFEAVSRGDLNITKKLSVRFFRWMRGQSSGLNGSIRLKALEFVLWAERIAYMQGGMVYHYSVREGYLDTLMSFQTFQELEFWYVQKMQEACGHIEKKRQEKTDNIVEQAKEYIGRNYMGDLSLEDTARKLGISAYYLSKLFKESEGVNYIDYVTGLRMDNAKAQLSGTEKSVKEICLESGYADPNYFSRIFKKWTGVTPTEYREGDGYEKR